ncbi:hypothetical protein BJV74DRAFT_592588 [Russula compacta]|nr:hypothetical protein BJV74DRAFT_592588 [Russula compacta]
MSVPAFDYYKILGLTKGASSEDVRRAYKQKVLETHPDKLPPDSTEEEKAAGREQFSRVHEASEILGDAERRREYDIHYRELPEPSIKSASSPKSATVSVFRSDSISTVRTAGSRPANLARTSSTTSSMSARSASKSHNDSSSFVSQTTSMTSAQTTTPSAKSLSRTNSVVTTPVARTNTISSSHSDRVPPSSVSRANSSASARQAQDAVSRSNSTATVRGAPPSVSGSGSVSSDHQLPPPLSSAPSTSSSREPPALPSISRTNSVATVRSSTSTRTSTHVPQPMSRSNSTVTAPPQASVSRSNSMAAVTAISLHETSSIVRSNTRTTALTSVSARSKAISNYSNRISMATVASAFSDLPAPPYSQPKDYDELVGAMLQELYRLNPEWVERKQRLQQVCIKAQREAGIKVDSQLLRASWAS